MHTSCALYICRFPSFEFADIRLQHQPSPERGQGVRETVLDDDSAIAKLNETPYRTATSEVRRMYCASCGLAVSPNLSFCNRCGAEVNAKNRDLTKRSEASQESLVWALALVTIVGIGAVIGLMGVMKEVAGFNTGLIVAFSLLVFLAFLGVDCVITWLLLRQRRDETASFKAQQSELTTNQLESKARMLSEPSFSITDHTTHTLDPVERKGRSESDQG
jgi:hypothetical protein